MTRKELLNSKEYWLVKIQTQLYNELNAYLKDNKMTRTQLAAKLGVSKGYISQILNGDFNHSISKLIELSLAINKVPVLHFEKIDECIYRDSKGVRYYETLNTPTVIRIELSYNPVVPLKNPTKMYEAKESLPSEYSWSNKTLFHSFNKSDSYFS